MDYVNILAMVMKTGNKAAVVTVFGFITTMYLKITTTKHLKYICAHQLTTTEVQSNKNACTNDGIMITRANNKITVNGLQKFTITENYINGIKQVHSVIMPSLSSSDVNSLPGLKSVVDFAYDIQRKPSMVT